MSAVLKWLLSPNWRFILAAMFSIVILHILATLAAPSMTISTPYTRIAASLPANEMTLLKPVGPKAQPAPFTGSEFRMAMCRYDTEEGPVALTASLPAPGWSLSLYDPDGSTIYAAVAEPGRRVDVALLLTPDDDRFSGLSPEARGESSLDSNILRVPASEGIAVLRAPDSGVAYHARHEDELRRARCHPQKG